MGTDHTGIPKDLRPLNIVRIVGDEHRIAAGRNADGFFPNPILDVHNSPRSGSGFAPAMVSDSGLVGLVTSGMGMGWNPRPPLTTATVAVSGGFPGTGIKDVANLGIRVGGSNGVGSSGQQANEEIGDDSSMAKKVKFLCSFGGKILPRPSDGALRYVGGHTRIISVRKDISFHELVQKMMDTYGQPVMIKYQLPDEDLDALVSVSCPEDLDNMMEEYNKLVASSADGSAKLRVFLFSPSELEQSGLMQFGDLHDSGQRYVDAVNGIPDAVVGSRLTRRGSIVSATSTQNSDSLISAGDAIESLGMAQGEGGGLLSPGTLSPRVAATASLETTRSLYMGSNSVVYAETPFVTMGHPVVVPVPTDCELQRPVVPAGGQQQQPVAVDFHRHYGMNILPAGAPSMDFPASSAAHVDSHQDSFNLVDSPQLASHIGYPNNQTMGLNGPLYRRIDHLQQLRDSITVLPPHHVISATQMTMGTSAPQVSTNPNVSQQIYQSQLYAYPEGHLPGASVVQPLNENIHRGYQHQPPPFFVPVHLPTGACDWRHVPPLEQAVLSEGTASQQQKAVPEQGPGLEDCYMCQKALPHAHSDTLVQDQRSSSISSVSNPAFYSLHSEDNLMAHPLNRLPLNVETNNDALTNQFAVRGLAPNHELQHNDHESILLQKHGNPNISKMINKAMVGGPSDVQMPYGVYFSNVPQFCQDDTIQHSQNAFQTKVNQKACYLANQPVGNEVPITKLMPIQTLEPVSQESAPECCGNHPGIILKGDCLVSSASSEHLRPLDARMEAIHISSPEISIKIEQHGVPSNGLKSEDVPNVKSQITGKEMLENSSVPRPRMVYDHLKLVEPQSSSCAEGAQVHNLPPIESNRVTVRESFGVSGQYPHLNNGIHLVSSEGMWHGEPAFSTVDSAYATGGVLHVDGWKDEASRSQFSSRMVSNNIVAGPSTNGLPPSTSPSSGIGDDPGSASSNSLFSNQDPWTLRHGTNFSPPKPSKVPISIETVAMKDDISLPQLSGNLNNLNSENNRCVKGFSDEHIKQELQAVAEGVAASVLQSTLPSDQNGHETIEPIPEAYQHTEINDEEEEMQCATKLVVPKDSKTELLEKMMPPILLDSIGSLQIIKNCDLEELRELGSGTFGTVYHGKWRGSDVAIKRINDRCFAGKPSEQDRMRQDFWNEAIKLADLHHPNVVAFYGVVLDGPGGSVATVTEYMVNGSLRQALQRNDRTLDKRKRLMIAMDVAFGMEYLHGKNIVHFDLKSDNLLVNLRDPHRPICKVGDLGLSKVKCQTLISGGVRGTLPWMAPELLNGSSNLVSEKVDVFSFGIVMWELLTGEEPYADLHYGAIIGGIVSNTLRPPVPESCDPEWKSLMEKCWAAEPSERPSFTEIANQLRSMAASLPPKGQAQQHSHSAPAPQAQK